MQPQWIIAGNALKNAFNNAWKIKNGISIQIIEKNLFIFKFGRSLDKKWVLWSGLWIFDNHLLILEELGVGKQITDLKFNKVGFWIGLINPWLCFQNKVMARKIGDHIEKFLDVEWDEDGLC